jgi:hypothetical protein
MISPETLLEKPLNAKFANAFSAKCKKVYEVGFLICHLVPDIASATSHLSPVAAMPARRPQFENGLRISDSLV